MAALLLRKPMSGSSLKRLTILRRISLWFLTLETSNSSLQWKRKTNHQSLLWHRSWNKVIQTKNMISSSLQSLSRPINFNNKLWLPWASRLIKKTLESLPATTILIRSWAKPTWRWSGSNRGLASLRWVSIMDSSRQSPGPRPQLTRVLSDWISINQLAICFQRYSQRQD